MGSFRARLVLNVKGCTSGQESSRRAAGRMVQGKELAAVCNSCLVGIRVKGPEFRFYKALEGLGLRIEGLDPQAQRPASGTPESWLRLSRISAASAS